MAAALFFMANTRGIRINSRIYDKIRTAFIEREKIRNLGENNPMYGVDARTLMTPEAVKEMSRKRSEALRKRVRKQSTFKKLSEGKMGVLNPMYHKPTEQMPHYNKKCMRCIATGEYKYIEKSRVEEYLNSGWELRGNNRGLKHTEKAKQMNRDKHIGRKGMVHPITKDRKNPLPVHF